MKLFNNSLTGACALTLALSGAQAATDPTSATATSLLGAKALEALIPASVSSYRVAPNAAWTADEAGELADLLLAAADTAVFSTTDKPSADRRLELRSEEDGSAILEIDRVTGSVLFNAGLAGYKDEASTAGLPEPEAAVQLVDKQLWPLGLAAPAKERSEPRIGGLNMAVRLRGDKTQVYRKLVTVRYDRVLDGVPVHGASRVVAHLGKDGGLQGLIYNWPEVEQQALPMELMRTASEVRGLARERVAEAAKGAKRVRLQEADYVLYDDGKGRIDPAIYMVVQLDYPDYSVPFDFYVPLSAASEAVFPYDKDQVKIPAPSDPKSESERQTDD